jgi:AcrR family transcriptional regulator
VSAARPARVKAAGRTESAGAARGPEARKRAIIASATKLFCELGREATMSDIVTDIGGSKATLYKHFPSKDALFQAVIQALTEIDFESIDALLAGDAPLGARVRNFARAHIDYCLDPRVVMLRQMLAPAGPRSKTPREIYETNVVPQWRAIAKSLAREMQRGALRSADSWRAAMHLKSLIEGDLPFLLVAGAIDPPAKPARKRLADDAADIFLRAYAPQRARPAPRGLA